MQIPLPMGSYKHPSRPSNYQICVNYFPSAPGPNGRGAVTLLPTMGTKLISEDITDEVRFIKNINGTMYFVIGDTFYSSTIDVLTQSITLEELGTLNTNTGVVTGTNNPSQIMLADGTNGYIYNFIFSGTVTLGPIGGTSGDTYTLIINGVNIYNNQAVSTALTPEVLVTTINNQTGLTKVTATYQGGLLTLTGDDSITSITVTESGTGFTAGTDGITVSPGVFSSSLSFSQFEQINDPNFIGGSHVIYIDGYFIINNVDSQNFQFSQPNEGRIWNALDVAAAESKPDLLVALGETKGELWAFGSNSIEVWYDNSNPVGSPFSKRIGSDIDIGCKARYSVTNVNDLLVWVDSRGFIVQSDVSAMFRDQSTGYTLSKISDEALDNEIQTYIRIDDAIGTTYIDRGHIMYEITFPTAKKTWVYDFNTKVWHERNFMNTDTGGLEHSLNQFCDTYETILICGGVRDGSIFIMSPDYFDDNGVPIIRMFTTQQMNVEFKQMGIDGVELKLETGYGGMSGYLANTQVIMQFSNDSGYTWSNEIQRPIGSLGEYMKRITWNQIGTSYQWLLLFKITAPIKHAVVDLSINLNVEQT